MKYHIERTIERNRLKRMSASRLGAVFIVTVALLLAVAAAALLLQFGGGRRNLQNQSETNMFCTIPQPPVRGDIYDRNGLVLAVDYSDLRAVRIFRNCKWEEIEKPVNSRLAAKLKNATGEEIDSIMRKRREKRFVSISRIIESRSEKTDTIVDISPRRVYPRGEYVSHIIGYLGEISGPERDRLRHLGYRAGDRVGKAGVEREYETYLTGRRGGVRILTDARGDIIERKRIDWSTKGKDLYLTIDMRLQKAAVDSFRKRGKKGAAVVMDSATGEILAMASWPVYSPLPGADGMTPARWPRLTADPEKPMLNRAVSSHLPLGSVFKLAVAAAALETGAAKASSSFYCPGYYLLPGRRSNPPRCYTSHGHINFVEGIAQSCDVEFYTLGQRLGVTKIKKYAKILGLGTRSGTDLPGEAVGLVPDEFWKRHFGAGSRWTRGDTINLSIGQGDMQVTPMQVARMVNVFATKGKIVTPHVAKTGGFPSKDAGFKPGTYETIRLGMRGAVLRGTCRGMSDFPAPVAAKTGTAQTGTRTNPKPPHSWFAGFVPYDNPRLTFAVYVEHGGYGAEAALPVAKDILTEALRLGYLPGYKAPMEKAMKYR